MLKTDLDNNFRLFFRLISTIKTLTFRPTSFSKLQAHAVFCPTIVLRATTSLFFGFGELLTKHKMILFNFNELQLFFLWLRSFFCDFFKDFGAFQGIFLKVQRVEDWNIKHIDIWFCSFQRLIYLIFALWGHPIHNIEGNRLDLSWVNFLHHQNKIIICCFAILI